MDEIFPCWYRSAPPKKKNQRVRKAADLCLLGLDSGVGLSFTPSREQTKHHNYGIGTLAQEGAKAFHVLPGSIHQASGSGVTPFPPGCLAPHGEVMKVGPRTMPRSNKQAPPP